MDMFLPLLLLLVFARVCGEIASRLGQASLVGEIFGGVILAQIVTPFASDVPQLSNLADNVAVIHVVDLGIFFLILSAGIEMQAREITRGAFVSLSVALGGMIFPFSAGIVVGWAFLPNTEQKLAQMLVIGIALSISAVPVTVEILREFRMLHHPIGRTVVSAAIFDDIFGLLLLTALVAVIRTGNLPDFIVVLMLIGKVVVFFIVSVAANILFYRWIKPVLGIANSAIMGLTAIAIGGLFLAVLAETLGLHFILGPFMVGLFFERSRVGLAVYRRIQSGVDLVARGFLVPIFFASIGFRLDPSSIFSVPAFVTLLIAIAFMGKVLGAGGPALIAGMRPRDSLAVGVGMSARGMIELVIVTIAYKAGLFSTGSAGNALVDNLFSALVLMAIVTTVVTPMLLRVILRHKQKGSGACPRRANL